MKVNFTKKPVPIGKDKPAFMRNSFFDKKLNRKEEPVKINYARKPVRMNQPNQSVNTDLSKGMRDDRQPDKMPFDTFQRVENLFSDNGNLVLRPGFEKLTESTNLLDLYIHETKAENELYVAQIDGTDKDVLKVNREDGTTTEKFTMTGAGEISFASLRGFMYLANETGDVQIWDGTTPTTIALPTGSPKLLTTSNARLWATDNSEGEEVLYFSKKDATGVVTSFSTGGTEINRSGIATSQITNYKALVGVGNFVIAFGRNRIECHWIPEGIGLDVDAFYADVTTLKWESDKFGVENSQAVMVLGNEVFFKTTDNYLYKVNASSGKITQVFGLEKTMSQLDWTNAKLSYYNILGKNLILINGKDRTDGDTTIAYNIKENSYSIFTNIFPEKITFDDDGFYWTSPDKFIFQFTPDAHLDDGLEIDWKVLTQASYAGDMMNYKKLFQLFLQVIIFENIDIRADVFVNRRTYGKSIAEVGVTYESTQQEELFEKAPEIMGIGMFAGALVTFDENVGTEIAYNSAKINRPFQRVEVQYSGSSKERIEIKGAGFSFFPTNKKVKNLIYT